MRLPLLLAALFLMGLAAGCSKEPEPQPKRPEAQQPETRRPEPDQVAAPAPGAKAEQEPAGDNTEPGPKDGDVIAVRRYEHLMNGQRAAAYEVRWEWATWNDELVVKDTTRVRSRTARMMGPVKNVFESDTTSILWRRESGELLELRSVTRHGKGERIDKNHTKWTGKGYRVELWTGDQSKVIEVESERMAVVDAETAVGWRIRAGKLQPGTKLTYPSLHALRGKVEDVDLEVVGQDEEGPGLKVIESFEGNKALWWFAKDGSVVRNRSVTSIIRLADVTEADLPRRPAAFRITLDANINLPRIFTGQRMVVKIDVETDETTRPPQIPENSFTRILKTEDDSITVELLAHDDDDATATLPMRTKGLERFLKPERTMEVDSPRIRGLARRIVGSEKDAREAARRIADWVFRNLRKESPPLGEPTALQILDNPTGDCSEHNLLFVTLCRAAGIPARRCSGYVCIGPWGSHAWCEIYVGRWIGADATTNEIGTRARYIMLDRPDEAEVTGGRITAERTELTILRAEYEDGAIDVEAAHAGTADPAVLWGVRTVEPLPKGWTRRYRSGRCELSGPVGDEEAQVIAMVRADQGYRALDMLTAGRSARRGKFGGVPCAMQRYNRGVAITVPLGREHLTVFIRGTSSAAALKAVAAILDPTLDRSDARRRAAESDSGQGDSGAAGAARPAGGAGRGEVPAPKPGR